MARCASGLALGQRQPRADLRPNRHPRVLHGLLVRVQGRVGPRVVARALHHDRGQVVDGRRLQNGLRRPRVVGAVDVENPVDVRATPAVLRVGGVHVREHARVGDAEGESAEVKVHGESVDPRRRGERARAVGVAGLVKADFGACLVEPAPLAEHIGVGVAIQGLVGHIGDGVGVLHAHRVSSVHGILQRHEPFERLAVTLVQQHGAGQRPVVLERVRRRIVGLAVRQVAQVRRELLLVQRIGQRVGAARPVG
mmetsp:Transcript_19939/g.52209  ORF Transcript_19939/g.52209 Transcript_19939/m.52209 type:complete len:253 (+) Transcript_19939:144-902(+)